MRHLFALALMAALFVTTAHAQESAAQPAAQAAPVAAPAPAAPAPAAQPAKQQAPAQPVSVPQPEADFSGLPIRPDIEIPDPSIRNTNNYMFNAQGVNCSLYPARCR